MENKGNKEVNYSIGLDIGTTSVGWAVTDEQAKLLKKGNQPLWGYNLFEEASAADDRRVFRGTRRRYKRRKQRVKLLQDFCAPMISEVDPLFYRRLENSYLVEEDRKRAVTGDPGNIFFVSGITDKEFYKKYPTVYHLRKALMQSDEKADPRLIYLALHHIVKYRGNFLYEGQDLQKAIGEDAAAEKMKVLIEDLFSDADNGCFAIDCKQLISILINSEISRKERLKNCQSLVTDKTAKEFIKEIANAVLGYKFSVEKLFGVESKTISFSDSDIDDKKTELESSLKDSYENFEILESIYSFAVLKNILSKSSDMSISSNMIAIYEKHGNDLTLLKSVLRQNKNAYEKMFSENGIYQKYIKNPSKTSQDDLYKGIESVLKELDDNSDIQKIRSEMQILAFLPRQNSISNGAIPYQLHLEEMKQIIRKQGRYYRCLKENEGKLESIVSFRIPYYVGPLVSHEQNQFAWMKRSDNSSDPIRPWSWDKQIDREATAAEFIKRMQNHCTYLLAEDTLPKNSILVNRFNVMNELCKMRVDDKLPCAEVRNQIIDDLFLKKTEVKKKDLKNWLIDHQLASAESAITGINDQKFNSSLKSEIKFRSIFGEDFDRRIEDIETLIDWLTVYNSKDILKTRIENTFKGEQKLTDQQMKEVLSLHYTGYGRFSRKLINGLVSRNQTGCVGTIMEIMEQSQPPKNENFMQILNNPDYGFLQQIEDENEVDSGHLSYSRVAELPGSPALKRGIWQSIRVVQDIVKYMKREPENIYLEFARNEGEKKQTISRYRQLEKIYKEYLSTSDIKKELEKNEKNLDNDRLYLYFIQQGKCMYSGLPLDISQLDKYQIDHILPQSYIVDNSVENRALVISEQNQRKADSLLLDDSIVKHQYLWWKSLMDMNLIGSKKFHNLTRKTVTEQERAGFVARQLVETRQICVHVKNILSSYYTASNVRTLHAPLSSEFRKKFGIYKIRELNSVHHAQDAYLACLMGGFVQNRFPYLGSEGKIEYRYIKDDIVDRIKIEYVKHHGRDTVKDERIMYSFIVNKMKDEILYNKDTGVVYWGGTEQIEYIKKIFSYKNYFFSYQTRQADGKLYDATIYSKDEFAKEVNTGIATKRTKPVNKYGGYKSIKKSYGLAVRYSKGKKTLGTVVSIPIALLQRPDQEADYVKKELGVPNVEIIRKIELGQAFIENNCLFTMTSPEEWRVRQPIFLSAEDRTVLYAAKHRKDKPSTEELSRVYFNLLKKIYLQIPLLRRKIDGALGKIINADETNVLSSEELTKQAMTEFEKTDTETQIKEIDQLLYAITISGGGSMDICGNGIYSAAFGRFCNKSINLDATQWVFTSPSGIYKTIVKL